MRKGIPTKAVALLALAVLLSRAPRGYASTFVLDPAESYLTMVGSSFGLPVVPQTPGSLTTSLSGTLQIGQNTVNALRITGSLIKHSEQSGPFEPVGSAVSFAGQVNYSSGYYNGKSGYFSTNNSHSHLWGALPIAGGADQYSADQLKLTFATPQLIGQRPSDKFPYVEAVSTTLDMAVTGPATITPVGTGYRVEIPILSNSVPVLEDNLDMHFTGRIVGYSDVDPRSTPEIVNGTFVTGEGWFDPDQSGRAGISPVYEQSFQEDLHDSGMAVMATAQDRPVRLAQEILGPGMLLPNTLYQVTFDVGNANTERSYEEMDPDTSVDVYWSLGGLTRSGDYDDAGGVYRLDRLSDIPDQGWRRDQSIVFDTSHLTPKQLAQGANLILQASAPVPGYWRSAVRFDNVRIAIVPEPSSIVLATSAAAVGYLLVRQRRRNSTPAVDSRSFKSSPA